MDWEVQEYIREKNTLEMLAKQAHALVWGQCSRPMREKLLTVTRFKTTKSNEDNMELVKAIKSTLFKFDNKCNSKHHQPILALLTSKGYGKHSVF